MKTLTLLAILAATGCVRHDWTFPVMSGNTNQIVRVRSTGFGSTAKLAGAEISYDGDIMTVRLKGYESDTVQAIRAAKDVLLDAAKTAK
jgi:hypothetical protein